MKRKRQLSDRIEEYDRIIEGVCKCGQRVNKVIGSNQTNWRNGDRYHYPNDNTAWCIFRCKNCGEPIDKTFNKPNK